MFDVDRFATLRVERHVALGDPLIHAEVTGSTNDDALAAARQGAAHGATFVADEQTRGRGRRGRSWSSPPGENLTFSVLLRPKLPAERIAALPLAAGLAVRAAAAERVQAPLDVKWPNDVVTGEKKLAGVLVESQLQGADLFVVVGIGVNVSMVELPPEIRDIATSLALLGDPAPDCEAVLADVLAELDLRLRSCEAYGLAPLVAELRLYDALAGELVTVEGRTGIASGFDDDGALLLRDAAGTVHRVSSGIVERSG